MQWILLTLGLLLASKLKNQNLDASVSSISEDSTLVKEYVPKHFSFNEFDSTDTDGSGYGTGRAHMSRKLLVLLDTLRIALGKPIIINSGFRTITRNAQIGGVSNSAHTKGLAVDIHCPNIEYQDNLVNLAKGIGFVRIGKYVTPNNNLFVHLDIDESKPYQGPWFIVKNQTVSETTFEKSRNIHFNNR